MAIKLDTKLPGRTGPVSAEWPLGEPRDRTESNNGTPFVADWMKDFEALRQAVITKAGITPSDIPDTVTNSQWLEGFEKVFSQPISDFLHPEIGTSPNNYVLDLPANVQPFTNFRDGLVFRWYNTRVNTSGGMSLDVSLLFGQPENTYNYDIFHNGDYDARAGCLWFGLIVDVTFYNGVFVLVDAYAIPFAGSTALPVSTVDDALRSLGTTVTSHTASLDIKVSSDPSGITGAAAITNIVSMTQASYDALVSYDATTQYVIQG